MSKTSNKNSQSAQNEIEVLYQRLGDKWYAFSVVGEEVLYGAVPSEALSEPLVAESKPNSKRTHPITGRS